MIEAKEIEECINRLIDRHVDDLDNKNFEIDQQFNSLSYNALLESEDVYNYFVRFLVNKPSAIEHQHIAMMFYLLNAKNNIYYNSNHKEIYVFNENTVIWDTFDSNSKDQVLNLIGDELGNSVYVDSIHFLNTILKNLNKKNKEGTKEEQKILQFKIKIIQSHIKQIEKLKSLLYNQTYKNLIWPSLCIFITNNDIVFDKNPDFLPIGDSYKINLKNGEVTDRIKSDLFSHSLKNLTYLPYENFPNVRKYVNSIFVNEDCTPNQELVDFMQVLLGYFLTGHIDHRCIYVFTGKTKNGKSKLIKLLEFILGKFFSICSKKIIIKNKGFDSNTAPEVYPLSSSRAVCIQEIEEGESLDAKNVKNFTGDDIITGRMPYEKKLFQFRTSSKIILCTNKKPNYDSSDNAMNGRLVIIPFYNIFDPNTKDPEILEFQKLFDSPDPDFLNQFFSWMVEGSIKYYESGFPEIPKICQDVIDEYKESNDDLQDFLDTNYMFIDPEKWNTLHKDKFKNKSIKNTDFIKAFKIYLRDKRRPDLSKKDIEKMYEDKNFKIVTDSSSKIKYLFGFIYNSFEE